MLYPLETCANPQDVREKIVLYKSLHCSTFVKQGRNADDELLHSGVFFEDHVDPRTRCLVYRSDNIFVLPSRVHHVNPSDFARCHLSASPATGLVGMEENVLLSEYFTCAGFLSLILPRYSCQRDALCPQMHRKQLAVCHES